MVTILATIRSGRRGRIEHSPTDKMFEGYTRRREHSALYYAGARFYGADWAVLVDGPDIVDRYGNPQSLNRIPMCAIIH